MLFRSRLRDPNERPKLVVVLHAMMVCALRYVANERLATDWLETYPDASQRSRELVILSGMDGLSVENLQALVIVTFVHIGDGEANKAWPLIGTLARGVVYLGLHTEPEETQRGEVSLKPLSSLSPARVWTEAEERRRVFWNVFLLDRFCSTATGWNTNLSSEDVQVRLPSDGLYWVKEEPVTTPFFNVWDSSLGRMGKSVSFLPSHFTSLADQDKQSTATAPTSERVTPDGRVPENRSVDVSTIGSFAYCVEATESLNRVVKFFLQRPVDFQSKQEFRAWLTRFKELDLQLIHWKMFLPRRWKDSNISKEPAFVHMDPNLTLAHITHNTSMILLHQSIAYPRASILEKVRLASTASAETCQLAASETANIVQKYLQYTPFVGLVNHQFSLCTYLSARVMLIHSHTHQLDIPDAYHILLSSLQQMSSRWVSMNPSLKLTSNATDFSQGLSSQLHTLQRMIGSPSFNVTASDYVAEVNHALGVKLPAVSPGESQWLAERRTQQRHSIIPVGARHSHYLDTNGLRTGSDHQSPFSHTMQTPSSGSMHSGRTTNEDHASVPTSTGQSRHALAPQAQHAQPGGDLTFNEIFTSNNATQPLGDNLDGISSCPDDGKLAVQVVTEMIPSIKPSAAPSIGERLAVFFNENTIAKVIGTAEAYLENNASHTNSFISSH
ncbi:hypothetical protein N7448_005109 [Penicillium atrosanguineum]|uniref:uncharacterized protein n=1 Tax=Penicillium atrosanguineum TaxID=1132637 RepID=UPI00239BDD1B|nr:uncharacterized protein N7443_008840 [Penicillium atrosanguineum]KAJ5125795.1 hypothetical protein N7526_007972 [Penicillium atrosanguineum]KAJ5136555.1 hypothetical protein N7448_005109 [Penicillium atrosanguineum]KAJ5292887.1 hypothetical protein N7443_008840 [Penicillium atrosanguineum]